MPYPQGAYEVPGPNHLLSIINNLYYNEFYQKNEKKQNFSGAIFKPNGDTYMIIIENR